MVQPYSLSIKQREELKATKAYREIHFADKMGRAINLTIQPFIFFSTPETFGERHSEESNTHVSL